MSSFRKTTRRICPSPTSQKVVNRAEIPTQKWEIPCRVSIKIVRTNLAQLISYHKQIPRFIKAQEAQPKLLEKMIAFRRIPPAITAITPVLTPGTQTGDSKTQSLNAINMGIRC